MNIDPVFREITSLTYETPEIFDSIAKSVKYLL